MKRKTSFGLLVSVFTLTAILLLAASCSMFEETESHISGPDKIACQQFNDSSFAELDLVPVTDFNPAWTGSGIAANIGTIIDSLAANDLTVYAGLDSAYHFSRTGDSTFVAFHSDIPQVTVFYTDVVDLSIFSANGQEITYDSDIMPQETIADCRDEEISTYEGNIIKVRYEYSLNGSDFLMLFTKTDNTVASDLYLTVQSSN